MAGCQHSPGLLQSVGLWGSSLLHRQDSEVVPAPVAGTLPWESPVALTNLLQETPTHRRAEGADVPFTALSPALQKTNVRDYLTDTSLLFPSITCVFLSKSCRLCEWPCRPL